MAEGVTLIGGEMVVWSDLQGTHGGPPTGGPALAALLGAVAPAGRTLVAGPHSPELIDVVAGGTGEVVLLVRGVADAEALAARYAGNARVSVCCGGLEKIGSTGTYDTVLALDGLARLSSVESVELDWGSAFELLLASLGPAGTLLLGVENYLGLHRLVAVPPAYGDSTDTDWVVASEYDATRPAGLGQLTARLESAGLTVAGALAAYPTAAEPTLLLGAEALAAPELNGLLHASLAEACRATGPVLTDPARLATRALRHGTAAELAPAWVIRAGRGAGSLPLALLGTDELTRGAGGDWRLAGEPVPTGQVLEDLLLSAALRRDLPAVRELLSRYQMGFMGLTVDNVLLRDGELIGAVNGRPAVSLDVALHRFAVSLIEGRQAHPWPTPLDSVELAATLAAMAGHELDRGGLVPEGAVAPDARSYQELSAANEALTRQLAEATAKATWYEQMLTSRENSLKRAQRIIKLLSGSVPYRVGKALIGPVRSAKRTARAAVRRIRPRT